MLFLFTAVPVFLETSIANLSNFSSFSLYIILNRNIYIFTSPKYIRDFCFFLYPVFYSEFFHFEKSTSFFGGAFFLHRIGYSESLSPFISSAFKHFSSIRCFHSCSETVLVCSFSFRWLKCSFHFLSPLKIIF